MHRSTNTNRRLATIKVRRSSNPMAMATTSHHPPNNNSMISTTTRKDKGMAVEVVDTEVAPVVTAASATTAPPLTSNSSSNVTMRRNAIASTRTNSNGSVSIVRSLQAVTWAAVTLEVALAAVTLEMVLAAVTLEVVLRLEMERAATILPQRRRRISRHLPVDRACRCVRLRDKVSVVDRRRLQRVGA